MYKLGALRGVQLQALLYTLNGTPASYPEADSAMERFLGRNPRQNNIRQITSSEHLTNVKVRQLRIAREKAIEKAALSLGRANSDDFRVSEKVRVRDQASGVWSLKGHNSSLFHCSDGKAQAAMVKLEGDKGKVHRNFTCVCFA